MFEPFPGNLCGNVVKIREITLTRIKPELSSDFEASAVTAKPHLIRTSLHRFSRRAWNMSSALHDGRDMARPIAAGRV